MENPASTAGPASPAPALAFASALSSPRSPDVVELAQTLIHTRQSLLPRRLREPGPDAVQTQLILAAAAHAPDHHELLPWRFVLVPADARAALGDAFAAALLARDANATPGQLAQAREKAFRAPLVLLAVARLADADAEIEPHERIVSAGAAIQNMLLMTHALGFGSSLTSGKALQSFALRELFALGEHEQALCFVNIGSVERAKPMRMRPPVEAYLSTLSV